MRGWAFVVPLCALLLLSNCGAGRRHVESGILTGDTVWKGRIEVQGVYLVDRGAHLVIKPGTEVVFLYTDRDGDGIGDGELNVIGTITAVGTPERPIVFRSERAEKKGWTFLHLSGNRRSTIEYAVFRDAFTGIQLHYVNAHVRNCLFTENHEGLRYSTVRGEISHNIFRSNGVGIRFEGRKSDVDVKRNLFESNDIAVFPVTLGSAGDRFRRNNFSSTDYNVRLGLEQSGDLDFSHNFWGTADRIEVEETIFDSREDSSLGTVKIEPILPVPASAGTEVPIIIEQH